MDKTPNEDRQESREDAETKTFDLDYVKKLREEAADYRTKARENAEAATELRRVREEATAEAQKAASHAAELQSALDKAEVKLRRMATAITHGISVEDMELFLTGSDEETLAKQAERLKALTPAQRGVYVPNEGKNPIPGEGDPMRTITRSIFPA